MRLTWTSAAGAVAFGRKSLRFGSGASPATSEHRLGEENPIERLVYLSVEVGAWPSLASTRHTVLGWRMDLPHYCPYLVPAANAAVFQRMVLL